MTEPQWETVEVPRGAYISWGEQPGVQEVVGAVIDYAPHGGTAFDGSPCPQISLQLRAPTFSMNKQGVRTEHQIGDLVVLNAGLVSLKRAVQAMQIQPGDLIKIFFARKVQAGSGEVKEFDVQIARGAAKTAQPPAQQQPAPYGQQPPPIAYAQQAPPQNYSQPVQQTMPYAPQQPMSPQQPAYAGPPQPPANASGWNQPQQPEPPF